MRYVRWMHWLRSPRGFFTARAQLNDHAPLESEVVLRHLSERSVLHNPAGERLTPFTVAGRKRYATCSGVAWFNRYYLAVVNLYGGHLRVYRFHPGHDFDGEVARLELLHEMSEGIVYPEDVAISPNGSLLAVTHSMSEDFGVSLHRIDPASLAPGPAIETIRRGIGFHGLNFSPDSRYLAFTQIATPGYVGVVEVSSTPARRTCLLENPHALLKPKSVAFTSDGRFVAIALTLNAKQQCNDSRPIGMLAIHRFDAEQGVISADAVAVLRSPDASLSAVEMTAFLPTIPGEPYRLLAANQGSDVIAAFAFDPAGPRLVSTGIFLSGLSFPHGLDVSADRRFVAVTNYGDDTLWICRWGPHPQGHRRSSSHPT